MSSPSLRVLVVLAASTVVVAVNAAPAVALTDEIAYGCDLDICLVQPDAPGTVTDLTDNGATSIDEHPAWSPDGTRVAFVSNFGGGGRNIFVMQPDAPGNAVNLATQLTHIATNDLFAAPVWSPDGTKVAFERPSGVFVVAADGTTVTPVTVTPDGVHPTWSPDGTQIAFSRGEQVYVTSADGSGTPAPLANGGGHDPVWSPDGTKIAFDGINVQEHAPFVDLHVVNAAGGGTPVVTPIVYTQWTFAAWSPDGTKLAYRSTTANDGRIRVVHADGSQDIPLASAAQENDRAPSWSPDGTRVTFKGYRYDPAVLTNEVYVANTDGSGAVRALTTGGKNADPVWRPAAAPILTAPGPAAPGPAAPGPAAGTSLPGTARPPTVVWFTKRIPYTPGFPIISLGAYGCGGPACSVASVGTARGVAPPSGAALAAGTKKKVRPVVVGRGRMQVPADSTRPLKLTLTRAGIALLRARGTVTVTVTVTTSGPARPTVTTTKQVRVSYVKPAKRKRRR